MTASAALTRWSAPASVAGFVQSPPNSRLLDYAAVELQRARNGRALDIGCAAARNTVPLAQANWHVLGTDLPRPMPAAAADRVAAEGLADRVELRLAPMDRLPVAGGAFDLIVAHGIWNLARSGTEFTRAIAEAARVAAPQVGLFVFTFSRHTLPPEAHPTHGETIVFTEFSGQPQCFVTRNQLIDMLGEAGFALDPHIPLTEHNRHGASTVHHTRMPVIFRFAGHAAHAASPTPVHSDTVGRLAGV